MYLSVIEWGIEMEIENFLHCSENNSVNMLSEKNLILSRFCNIKNLICKNLFDSFLNKDFKILINGIFIFEYGVYFEDYDCILKSSKLFKILIKSYPESFEALYLAAYVFLVLGEKIDCHNWFLNSCSKYEKAIGLGSNISNDTLAYLYWGYGDALLNIAKRTRDLIDFNKVILAYDKVILLKKDLPMEFLVNLTNAHLLLANQTNNVHFIYKVINIYESLISDKKHYGDFWLNLGIVIQNLYKYTHDENHFLKSQYCYSNAKKLSKNDIKICLNWSSLLFEYGYMFLNEEKIRLCIDKCTEASKLYKDNRFITCILARALCVLGIIRDDIEYINMAKDKICKLKNASASQEFFYTEGFINMSLGKYYRDSNYYYLAIEVFQEGLLLNGKNYNIWHAMGRSALEAAMIDNHEADYKNACRFFRKALRTNITDESYFFYAISLYEQGFVMQDEHLMQLSIFYFEKGFSMQLDMNHVNLNWIFHFAISLSDLANLVEREEYYIKAIEKLNFVLKMNKDFPGANYRLAQIYSRYAEFNCDHNLFELALENYDVANKMDPGNDEIMLENAITIINMVVLLEDGVVVDCELLRKANRLIIEAARLGNADSYYYLSCLCSVFGDIEKSVLFFEKALKLNALPPFETVLEEELLKNTMDSGRLDKFIEYIKNKYID